MRSFLERDMKSKGKIASLALVLALGACKTGSQAQQSPPN